MLLLFLSSPAFAADPEAIEQAEARLASGADPTDARLELAALQVAEGQAVVRAEPARALEWYTRALAVYAAIPDQDPRADEARYGEALALAASGDADAANERFVRVVKGWPGSAQMPAAYLAIGHYYYERNSAFKALMAFQRAAAPGPSHPAWAEASFWLAWCYYKVGEFDKAIAGMRAVVEAPAPEPFRSDALRDLVRFYADAGRVEEGVGFLDGAGRGDLAVALLGRMAETHRQVGKFDAAIVTWRQLQARAPLAPEAGLAQVGIVEASRSLGQSEQVAAEVAVLRRDYGPGSVWAKANAGTAEAEKVGEALATSRRAR